MSDDHSLVIQLYWGGKIEYAGGSMLYNPPIPKKVMFLRERIGFDELMDKVYNTMDLDRNRYKISLIFRSCLHHGVFGPMPLVDDDGVDGMYFLKAKSGHATEIYVEMEEHLGLGQHHTQTLQIASPHVDRESSICVSKHMNMSETVGLFKSQLTKLDYEDVQPIRKGRKESSGHDIDMAHPINSQATMHISTVEAHGSDTDAATMFRPATNTNIEFVDVDMDSEPEPGADDSNDDDRNYGASRQGGNSSEEVINCQHVGPGAPRTINVTPKLRYEAGVDAILQFDPLDKGKVEKLNLWNERTKELKIGQLFYTKEHVKRAVKLWSIKENREYKVRESTPTTWYVRCKARDSTPLCNWQLRATLRRSRKMWMIVTLADEHTCIRVCNSNDHRLLSGDIITEHIIPHIIHDPLFKVKEIQTAVRKEFHCNVSYKKAWDARRKAMMLCTTTSHHPDRNYQQGDFHSYHSKHDNNGGESTQSASKDNILQNDASKNAPLVYAPQVPTMLEGQQVRHEHQRRGSKRSSCSTSAYNA